LQLAVLLVVWLVRCIDLIGGGNVFLLLQSLPKKSPES
jgi:hypothetical protein